VGDRWNSLLGPIDALLGLRKWTARPFAFCWWGGSVAGDKVEPAVNSAKNRELP
jgi:hypothetical protein